MPTEILNILLSALGVVITGLASFVVAKFTEWINHKLKDQKAATWLSTIMEIIMTAVKETYQTYVESLKAEGKFDAEAQKVALEKAYEFIVSNLTQEAKDFIEANYGDLKSWIISKIESTIYTLKNNK